MGTKKVGHTLYLLPGYNLVWDLRWRRYFKSSPISEVGMLEMNLG